MAMKKTLTALLALALTASLVGAAAAQEKTPNDPRLFTPGKLTVSTSDPAYPPWVLDNNPAGGEGFGRRSSTRWPLSSASRKKTWSGPT
jgi:polar amino acid transport system substrate-binding protein